MATKKKVLVPVGMRVPTPWTRHPESTRRSSDLRNVANITIGDTASLFEAGHAFSDLKVNPAVRTECAEVVLVDYVVRDAGQCKFHILVAGHGGAIVEILDI